MKVLQFLPQAGRNPVTRFGRFVLLMTFLLSVPLDSARAQFGQSVPALRVVSPNGARSVLIGSMHIAMDGLPQPSRRVMDGARVYVVEHSDSASQGGAAASAIDGLDPEAVSTVLQTGKLGRAPWARAVTDAQVGKLRDLARCALPTLKEDAASILLAMSTPNLASQIAWTVCTSPGLRSRDDLLARYAQERRLPTMSLESQAEIEGFRKRIPQDVAIQTFYAGLTDEAPRALVKTAAALARGDYDEIARLVRSVIKQTPQSDLANHVMVDQRNHLWLPRLRKHLDAGGAVVNVGAAHLPGANGLISLLRQSGYEVETLMLQSGDPTGRRE